MNRHSKLLFYILVRVYKNFDDSKFNFNGCPQEEILFYVNLDEEKILTKEQNSE